MIMMNLVVNISCILEQHLTEITNAPVTDSRMARSHFHNIYIAGYTKELMYNLTTVSNIILLNVKILVYTVNEILKFKNM